MEESDESDQPVSAGRQEIRKRRRPSQSMVDKSQQTEVTEKKKHLSTPQSSGPKATLSIGNIPGSKFNYECHRVSSQLQQTWTKRKHVHDMTDKSLQTETTAEEKKEIKSVCETVIPEEKPAAVGEAASEFPESVQEVEILPSGHSVQLKTDRSQQTSCTGDWTMMNIPQTVDKEQQTCFSESEIVVIAWPSNSFSKSKQGAQKRKSSGKIFVSEHTESQPTTSSNEEIRLQSINRALFIPPTKNDAPLPLEDEKGVPVEAQPPAAEETSAEVQLPLAEEISIEEVTAKVQPPPAEEAPLEVQSSPNEEAPGAEAPAKVEPIPAEEAFSEEPPVEVQPLAAEEPPVEIQPYPAEEAPGDEGPARVEPTSAEETLLKEAPAEAEPPPAEVAHAELHTSPAKKSPAQEVPEVQSPTAEEAPGEEASTKVQSPPAEDALAEEAPEVQSPPAEEAPAEEASANIQSPPAEEAPVEEVPEAQSPPAEQVPPEEASANVQSPPAEETPAEEASANVQSPPGEEALAEESAAELQPLPAEEASAEEAVAELQPLPTEETTSEMVSVDKQSLLAKESFITQISIKETSAEVLLPPSEQTPADEALVENVSTIYESPQAADVPVVKLESGVLEDKPESEEPLEQHTVPEDSSDTKNEEISIKIEGVLHIELQQEPPPQLQSGLK
ncbi:fibrous sheath CABYR-binding protein [Hippopotamus amphibius kiboko]|uniref:fibrous sheath CABYR-binding protein n=1 Tax=Hippopotamus amphibius kiboko TaxID=575201 RepID=UPI002592CF0E|nr:fibrous sheath CABYR-binding protein [Hippopotamus amphibius kiboko]